MIAVPLSAPVLRPPRPRLRVMIVDDAAAVRGVLKAWIDAEPDLQVVATLRTGRAAVEQLAQVDPDIVILDVEMPELDGLAALPLLLAQNRDLVVIMASTFTRRHAEVSIRALALGASDYIPKPTAQCDGASRTLFRRELLQKIRELGARQISKRGAPSPARMSGRGSDKQAFPLYRLRPPPVLAPRVLLIGASTGGPNALTALLSALGGVIDQAPVLITQHMPPTFTASFAEHLARVTSRCVREGTDGEPVRAGQVYLAPGGLHMRVARGGAGPVIRLDDGPPVNFCKPAVDPLFSSAAAVWGNWSAALILTGMGSDGARGATDVVAAGGSVIAQDEASSVVWGMPGAVVQAGLCSAVLPLDRIAGHVAGLFGGTPS